MTRETMQLRLAGPKRPSKTSESRSYKTASGKTLSAIDRERTRRELTRMQGERIKTQQGRAHVRRLPVSGTDRFGPRRTKRPNAARRAPRP